MFKSKLTKVVDFPMKGLDMTKYVIEKEPPSQYIHQSADDFKEVYILPAQPKEGTEIVSINTFVESEQIQLEK